MTTKDSPTLKYHVMPLQLLSVDPWISSVATKSRHGPSWYDLVLVCKKESRSIYIENTRWVSFDIKFTRQGFENACWHGEACRDIVNTRWVSFDIKFTRQGFENACWHGEACQAIQHVFSKLSLVNLISKAANLVFYLSVYQLFHSSN